MKKTYKFKAVSRIKNKYIRRSLLLATLLPMSAINILFVLLAVTLHLICGIYRTHKTLFDSVKLRRVEPLFDEGKGYE